MRELYQKGSHSQMHGLVPLNSEHKPVRHAILWNDTRNSEQCAQIKEVYGERLNGNPILEGFTPKNALDETK